MGVGRPVSPPAALTCEGKWRGKRGGQGRSGQFTAGRFKAAVAASNRPCSPRPCRCSSRPPRLAASAAAPRGALLQVAPHAAAGRTHIDREAEARDEALHGDDKFVVPSTFELVHAHRRLQRTWPDPCRRPAGGGRGGGHDRRRRRRRAAISRPVSHGDAGSSSCRRAAREARQNGAGSGGGAWVRRVSLGHVLVGGMAARRRHWRLSPVGVMAHRSRRRHSACGGLPPVHPPEWMAQFPQPVCSTLCRWTRVLGC